MLGRLLFGLSALLLFAAAPAKGGVDIDFGANVPIGDDANLFFHISSRCFDQDVRVVQQYAPRFANPDDLAVALFISQHSHRPVNVIFELRRGGLSWWDVGVRVGVPVDAWFVPIEYTPGPPYGHAYGHWKKHHADPHHSFRLKDAEARDLVALQAARSYYGAPPDRVMAWRMRGENVRTLMVEEYRGRHGDDNDRREWTQRNDKWEEEHGGKGHGEGQGHGEGKGKGAGQGRGHGDH